MTTIRTVGHGTLAAPAFVDLLQGVGVGAVVDVRRHPGSRRHPQFGSDAMAAWLVEAGLGYRWVPELGGRRTAVAGTPNTALRNAQFRGYADHMATDEFRAGIAALGLGSRSMVAEERRTRTDADGAGQSIVLMCAEALWWHCHRRLLADHLVLVEGDEVEHLFHDGRLARHQPTPEARVVAGTVVYDGGSQAALFEP